MNAPDVDVTYDGSKKRLEIIRDTRVPNAITARILKEDHTIGNLLRYQLLKDPRIVYTGYKVPHPLQYEVHVKLQTTGTNETEYSLEHRDRQAKQNGLLAGSPEDVLHDAVDHLIGHFKDIQDSFEAAFSSNEVTSPRTF